MGESAKPPFTNPTSDLIHQARTAVTPALRTAFAHLHSDLERTAAYHCGFTDQDGRDVDDGGGKLLRPVVTLLCAQAAGGTVDQAINGAVAVQLVHDFSLLHDDIMDGDATRRGRCAAWTVFGTDQALLAGDALLGQATRLLSQGGRRGCAALAVLADGVVTVINGQAADMAAERANTATTEQALRIARDKTAALFATAARLGAVLVGVPPHGLRAAAFHQYGLALGTAFQLADDLAGIWGDPAVLGKPVGADLARRKKSLPVAYALSSPDMAAAELRRRYAAPPGDDPDEVAELADLVERAGGRRWAVDEARRQVHAAIQALFNADAAEAARAELDGLVRSLLADMPGADHNRVTERVSES